MYFHKQAFYTAGHGRTHEHGGKASVSAAFLSGARQLGAVRSVEYKRNVRFMNDFGAARIKNQIVVTERDAALCDQLFI